MRWRPLSPNYGTITCKTEAPVLTGAAICDWLGNECPNWSILIDSGADRTTIPISAPAFLGIKTTTADPNYSTTITAGGVTELYPLVYVTIAHEDFGSILIKAACAEQDYILLGRDALAHLLLIYNGTHSKFFIRRRRFLDRIVLRCLRGLR